MLEVRAVEREKQHLSLLARKIVLYQDFCETRRIRYDSDRLKILQVRLENGKKAFGELLVN